MSNHAYESAAALRPQRCAPTALNDLAECFALDASRIDPSRLPEILVTGVSVDSGDVAAGELFTALPGFKRHGALFAAEAAGSGALAVLTDDAGAEIVRREAPDLPVLTHPDPRAVVGPLAARVYHHPARRLTTAAVTGTNGKTTTSYFLDAILAAHLGGCMIAGTVELRVGGLSVESPRTTVEAPVLQRMMALAVEEGVGAASLEASSHAIVLHRLDGFAVDVAGFTNLQRDHLDFHKTMQGYLDAKARLFTPEHARRGVVCVDDEWGARLADRIAGAGLIPVDRVRAYPVEGDPAQGTDWWVSDAAVSMTDAATTFVLHGPDAERADDQRPRQLGQAAGHSAGARLVDRSRHAHPTPDLAPRGLLVHNPFTPLRALLRSARHTAPMPRAVAEIGRAPS